jgi:hypothetical protein
VKTRIARGALTCSEMPETIWRESLNPKVQGSTPCANTIMFGQVRLMGTKGLRLMRYRPSADALHLLRLIGNTPFRDFLN